MNVILLRTALLLSVCGLGSVAYAQEADERALDELDKNAPAKVVPQNEAPGARELREAMRRISLRPSDVDALVDAGNAALLLGDGNAALNFFTRANTLQPSNGRIKAGLAAATVRTENPFEALRLFDDAVKLGVSERSIASDRAMAFDLLGNFERAQQDYRLARTASVSDELIIQQAISLSLLGRKNDADAMLVPLLQKENTSAWRARAFMLAARGDFRESTKVTQGFLDPESAQRIERYLRLMPQLTGAQQAAAIHLGHFPANNIGRDSEEVRRVASTIPPVATPVGSGRLIPTGDPFGPRKVDAKPGSESKQARRDREKAEQASANNAKLAVNLPTATKTNAKGGITTDLARARIEEATRASATLVTARDLPVPERTRAPVRVTLPVRVEPAIKIAEATRPKQQDIFTKPAATLPITPPAPLPKAPVPQQSIAVAIPTPVPAQPAPTPVVILPAASPISTPELKPTAIISPPPIVPTATPVDAALATASAKPIDAPSGPGFESLTTKAAPPLVQGPMPDGTIVAPIKSETSVAANVAAPTAEQTPPPVVAEKIEPVAAKPFDLGAFVGAIEIPESESLRKVAPVDLKKIKSAASKADALELEAKSAKTKVAANPARIWVQIATGPASAVGYDFRSWTKKKPELFKGRDGWSALWSKSARLLVGPFADLKTAKKWSADFGKAGGNGFLWNSAAGEEVKKLGGK